MPQTLLVVGLTSRTTKESILDAFLPFGEITDAELRGTTALVTFADPDDAEAARDNMNLNEISGDICSVSYAPSEPAT
jgi:RNA recognition motif-containing protein